MSSPSADHLAVLFLTITKLLAKAWTDALCIGIYGAGPLVVQKYSRTGLSMGPMQGMSTTVDADIMRGSEMALNLSGLWARF